MPFQLSRCFADFQSGGYFDALSPLVAPRCVFCSPESFSSLFIHSSLYLSSVTPILFLSFCASVKGTHRCSSPVSTLLQVPISPLDSHSVISPEAPAGLSSVHGRDTLTSCDVVKLHKTVCSFTLWSYTVFALHCGMCFCFCLAGYDEVEEIRPANSERQPIMTLRICRDDILLLSNNTYIRETCLFFSVFGKTKKILQSSWDFKSTTTHPSCWVWIRKMCSVWLVATKAGSGCFPLPFKTTKEERRRAATTILAELDFFFFINWRTQNSSQGFS